LLNKILTIVFAVLIVAATAAIIWLAVVPEKGDCFSEFYILGADGKAANYPRDVQAGGAATVIVGIVNHEHEPASYHVLVETDNITIGQADNITLADGQKWEEPVNFTPTKAGDNQTIDFLLYKNEQANPDLSLNLWVNVK
jgi:uncharacterized membrane protein